MDKSIVWFHRSLLRSWIRTFLCWILFVLIQSVILLPGNYRWINATIKIHTQKIKIYDERWTKWYLFTQFLLPNSSVDRHTKLKANSANELLVYFIYAFVLFVVYSICFQTETRQFLSFDLWWISQCDGIKLKAICIHLLRFRNLKRNSLQQI